LVVCHEPPLRNVIEAHKRYDGQVLGSDKVGEGSGKKEGKTSDIHRATKNTPQKTFAPKTNVLRNRLDTTRAPPVFLPQNK
jgi:hypothetical protein